VDLGEIEDDIYNGKYRFDTADKQPLRPSKIISQVWPQLPSEDQLHIYVTVPKPDIGSPALVDAGEYFLYLFVAPSHLRISDERHLKVDRSGIPTS
jgi:hypothetical protein